MPSEPHLPNPPGNVATWPIQTLARSEDSAILGKLLREMPLSTVTAHITALLMERKDWDDATLKRINKVLSDILWERV